MIYKSSYLILSIKQLIDFVTYGLIKVYIKIYIYIFMRKYFLRKFKCILVINY